MGDGDRAILLLGGSRSGKSSLVTIALAHSWPVLCDDTVVIHEEPAGHLVTGIPRPINVPRDLARSLGMNDLDPARGRDRVVLPRGLLRPGWWQIGAVLAVGHGTEEGGELLRFDTLESFAELVAAHAPSLEPSLFRRYYPHAVALSRLPSWGLLHDPDPSRRVASAAKLLDSVRSHLGTVPP